MDTIRPLVSLHMTPCPITARPGDSVARAGILLREHGIRHLPVVDEDAHLVGLLSDRDVGLVFALVDVDPRKVPAAEVMNREPFCVGPEAELGFVVETMRRDKQEAAVIVEDGKPMGIFTTIDALRLLGALLPARENGSAVSPG